MSRRPDDTTKPAAGSPPVREREPFDYYDDDGTGYEPFDPDAPEDEKEEDEQEDAP